MQGHLFQSDRNASKPITCLTNHVRQRGRKLRFKAMKSAMFRRLYQDLRKWKSHLLRCDSAEGSVNQNSVSSPSM